MEPITESAPRVLIDKNEAARRLGVHPDTIVRMGADGRLTVYRVRTGPKDQPQRRQPIRYDAAEVESAAYAIPTVRTVL